MENGGGSGSKNSHWERVVLENEFMTASASNHASVYSQFTFALLEDSGWYMPDYSYADPIFWYKILFSDIYTL